MQDKAAKAEEEAALLEEQSRHYKEQLDNALRQIEKQSVWHISSPSFSNPDYSSSVTQSRVHGCSLITKPRSRNPPRSTSQVIDHTFLSRHPRVLTLATKGNGKKATKKTDKGKGQQKSQPPASDSKGKRKAPPDEDRTDTIESENDTATKPTKSKSRKSRATTKGSQVNTDANVDQDDAPTPKKKKMRKLNVNLFASSKPDSLDWVNQFNLVNRITGSVS
jgi:hypothetical protein